MGLFLLPGYGLLGAFDGTKAATRTGLMVNMIPEKGLAYARITFLISYVGLVFITEITYGREYGIWRGGPQSAKGKSLNHLPQFLKELDIALPAIALADTGKDLQHLLYAFPAGVALTAGFLFEKIQEIAGHIHHTGVLVHYNHPAGPHDRPNLCQFVKINPQIQILLRDTSAGRASGLDRLESFLFWDTPSDIKDDGTQGGAHGDFHKARVDHLAHQREYLGPLAAPGAD